MARYEFREYRLSRRKTTEIIENILKMTIACGIPDAKNSALAIA
jgi:hypothetical protein